ncbi:MAG: V-type ATP synthase subunit F [Nanobdellota archaeon]
MDVSIIADEDTLLAFELAGVKNGIVFDKNRIDEDLKKVEDSKILIVTEEVSKYVGDVKPSLAVIPDKSGNKGLAMERLSKIFKSTIGVALKEED